MTLCIGLVDLRLPSPHGRRAITAWRAGRRSVWLTRCRNTLTTDAGEGQADLVRRLQAVIAALPRTGSLLDLDIVCHGSASTYEGLPGAEPYSDGAGSGMSGVAYMLQLGTGLGFANMHHWGALASVFRRVRLYGLPVVGERGDLLGVVRRAAVEAAVAARAGGDYMRAQGIVDGDEVRSMPFSIRARRRLSWLTVNIFLNLAAAGVVAAYSDTLTQVIALAVFMPIISDMSGNSGNQAVAVSIRELSLGLVLPRDFVRVWIKEISVGLINGAMLGLLLGLAAFLWKRNLTLSMVVAAALALNTLIAVSLGGLIPLLLRRMRFEAPVRRVVRLPDAAQVGRAVRRPRGSIRLRLRRRTGRHDRHG